MTPLRATLSVMQADVFAALDAAWDNTPHDVDLFADQCIVIAHDMVKCAGDFDGVDPLDLVAHIEEWTDIFDGVPVKGETWQRDKIVARRGTAWQGKAGQGRAGQGAVWPTSKGSEQ